MSQLVSNFVFTLKLMATCTLCWDIFSANFSSFDCIHGVFVKIASGAGYILVVCQVNSSQST